MAFDALKKATELLAHALEDDIDQFCKDVIEKSDQTITLTLTGRKGKYVGGSIKFDRYYPSKETSKTVDKLP